MYVGVVIPECKGVEVVGQKSLRISDSSSISHLIFEIIREKWGKHHVQIDSCVVQGYA